MVPLFSDSGDRGSKAQRPTCYPTEPYVLARNTHQNIPIWLLEGSEARLQTD
jgi:hypothetical protein